MNSPILLTWIKQGHHLQLMMAKLMKQPTQKMSGVSQVNQALTSNNELCNSPFSQMVFHISHG